MFKSCAEARDSVVILHLKGHLDALSSDDMSIVVNTLQAKGVRKVVCDLKDLSLLDSAGLGSILSFSRFARERNGRVAVTNLKSQPRVVFNALKMEKHMPVYDSVDCAVSSLHRLP